MKHICNCVALGIICSKFVLPHAAMGQTPSEPATITAGAGRPLANVLDQLQHLFLQPICYEEAPFESPADVKSAAVASSIAPNVALRVTLGATDVNPYFASSTALSAYRNAGLPGVYNAVQNNGWVAVVPSQVSGTDGNLRSVVPVMSSKATFPAVSCRGVDTLQLVVDAMSQASGSKVLLLNQPFWPNDMVTVSASGEQAGDVIQKIGSIIGRPVSYQCLYDASSQAYYLNVIIVSPPPVPGSTVRPRPLPLPLLGPPNSPWFAK